MTSLFRTALLPTLATVVAALSPSSHYTVVAAEDSPSHGTETIHIEKLENGATLILQERPGCGTFGVQIVAQGGAYEDPDAELGLTSVLARLLLRGSLVRTASQQALEVERTGSSFSSGGDPVGVRLWAAGPTPAFASVFDVLADAALHPRLEADDFQKESALARQSLRTTLDDPSAWLIRAARPLIFDGHRLGRVPDPETFLSNVGIESVRRAYADRFVGRRLIVAIVGDIDVDGARKRAIEAFGSLLEGMRAALPFDAPAPLREDAKGHASHRTSQPELLVAMPTAGVAEADVPAMDVLSHILGGFQERLSAEIREKRGWAYWLGSEEWRYPGAGLFGIRTAVPRQHLEEAERIIREELHRIATERPSEEEVERARRFLLTALARRWQLSSGRASAFVSAVQSGNPPRTYDEQAARYAAVTPEAVRDLARRLVDSSKLAVVTLY